MDLRLRLVGQLAGFSLMLLVAACALVGVALLDDTAREVEASSRLTDLMLAISELDGDGLGSVRRLLDEGGLRHLAVSIDRPNVAQMEHSGAGFFTRRVAGWMPRGSFELPQERRIAIGEVALVIGPDPLSEVEEILRESGRMIAIFIVFALVTIVAAWRTVHRALQPVRAIEEGLARLARGDPQAMLPRFELNEFRRIGHAIDRLAGTLADARANERRLGCQLIELQESERRELARELHDEFGQALTAIGVAAAFVERHAASAEPQTLVDSARDIRREAKHLSEHVRGLLKQLRPHGLDGLGMVDALAELLDTWRQRERTELVARLPPCLPPLSAAAGLAVYRTLQEALTNVRRHSGASRVTVGIVEERGHVVLTIVDNGEGCRSEALSRSAGGVLGMHERAEMAGGHVVIEAVPGGGLKIELSVPTQEKEGRDDSHPVTR